MQNRVRIESEISLIKPTHTKIDNRDTIRRLKSLLEIHMTTKGCITLFQVYNIMDILQELFGGYMQTLQPLELACDAIFYLEFQRSEINLLLNFNDEFNVTRIDVLWWHNGNLKYDANYWMENNGRWIFTCFKGKDKNPISDFPTLVA